jgi:hypothetical protein
MTWALNAQKGSLSIYLALPIDAVGLLLGLVVCHGELARSKPNPDYLTHFYLSLATGGALGGLLVGLVAPQVFNSYWEMPLALVALSGLGVWRCSEDIRFFPSTRWTGKFMLAALVTALILLLLGTLPSIQSRYTPEWAEHVQGAARWGCAAVLLISALLLPSRAVALTGLLCTVIFAWSYFHSMSTDTESAVRNFYGALRVQQSSVGARHMRTLANGVIVHGTQITDSPLSQKPTAYYGESSGIGRTILIEHQSSGSVRIGSIGLGAGTLAAYGRPGDLFRIYELNPAVVRIAQTQFTYLKNSKAKIELVLGDARLSLERQIAQGVFDSPDQRFDVLSVDAFSGDAIPVHLLTREAFASYVRVIKRDGVIAFHISNQYLNLAPVVGRIASEAGFQALLVADRPAASGWTLASDWALLTRSASFLQQPAIAAYSTRIVPNAGPAVWTDQFSNLLQILK